MELLQVDGLIADESEDPDISNYQKKVEGDRLIGNYENELKKFKVNIDAVVELVGKLDASGMELFSTTHYIFWAYKNFRKYSPPKDEVIDKVFEIKKPRFSKEEIGNAFNKNKKVGMFEDLE